MERSTRPLTVRVVSHSEKKEFLLRHVPLGYTVAQIKDTLFDGTPKSGGAGRPPRGSKLTSGIEDNGLDDRRKRGGGGGSVAAGGGGGVSMPLTMVDDGVRMEMSIIGNGRSLSIARYRTRPPQSPINQSNSNNTSTIVGGPSLSPIRQSPSGYRERVSPHRQTEELPAGGRVTSPAPEAGGGPTMAEASSCAPTTTPQRSPVGDDPKKGRGRGGQPAPFPASNSNNGNGSRSVSFSYF